MTTAIWRELPKGIQWACTCPQSTTSELLAVHILQQKEQREMKARGTATEVAREAY